MPDLRRAPALVLVTVLAVLSLAGCGSSSTAAPVDATDPGGRLVATKCVMCHSLSRIESASYDKAGWLDTVSRMQRNGLVITAEEKAAIVDYLASR